MRVLYSACVIAALLAAVAPARAADSAKSGEAYRTAQKAFLDENEKRPGWHKTASGLEYHALKNNSGPWPWYPQRSLVTVNYEGRLIDGTVFDSSYQRGEPATFDLSGLIKGWQEGIPMMRIGETWEFAIPAALAYGDRGAGPIPGGATLLFKIDLLDAKAQR